MKPIKWNMRAPFGDSNEYSDMTKVNGFWENPGYYKDQMLTSFFPQQMRRSMRE